MIRKLLSFVAAFAMVFTLAACGSPEEVQPEEQIDYEIALVTESGLLMNGGYSQVAWDTISGFGAAEGLSHKYYKAAEASDDAYKQAIDDAVQGGAKLIVADGCEFSQVIYEKQTQYKDVKFVIIDTAPMDAESGKSKITKNTAEVLFASEQAGYLAGYAVVKDGITQLGFMGDSKQSLTMDYLYGFLQGADKAAAENGVSVNIKYHYSNKDEDREQILKKSSQWYEDGTEAIFACGTEVEQPVIEAAELLDKKVIAYETEKSMMSDTIIVSAVKDIETALTTVLKEYGDDKFPGGKFEAYDVANGGIMLNLDKSRLNNLDKADYKRIIKQLGNGDIKVKKHDMGNIDGIGLSNTSAREQ